MKKRLTLSDIHALAVKKYGSQLGVFGRLMSKNGNPIRNKYVSYGMLKILTREEILKDETDGN